MDGKLSEKHEKHEEKSEWHQKGGDSSTSWQRVMKVTKKTETKMSSKTEQKTRTYKVIDLTGDEKRSINCKENDDDAGVKPKLDSPQYVESTITIKADVNQPGLKNPNTKTIDKEQDDEKLSDVPKNISCNQNEKSNRAYSCCPTCQKCSKCCKSCTIL